MKCMCAQTRPRFILSSEGVFGGMEFEPMLTPREKSPLPEKVPRGGSNPRHCGQRAQALPTELFRPPIHSITVVTAILSSHFRTASLGLWLRRPPRERKIPGSNPACTGIFPGSSHTSDLKIGTPVAPGGIGSVLGLVGPMSVHYDWVR